MLLRSGGSIYVSDTDLMVKGQMHAAAWLHDARSPCLRCSVSETFVEPGIMTSSLISKEIETVRGAVSVLMSRAAGGDAPLLHFAHATGLNAQTYVPLLDMLCDGHRVVASDMRGHGRSRLPANPEKLKGWETFERDLEQTLVSLAEPALLVGHSIGATISIMLAARRPELVSGVIAIEPSFVSYAEAEAADRVRAAGGLYDFEMARVAAKRRARWPSVEAAKQAYQGRGMFLTWPDEWLANYLAAGLRPSRSGGWRLSCSPAWECATFRAVTTEVWRRLPQLPMQLVVLRGTVNSTIVDDDAEQFIRLAPEVRDTRLVGCSHFLPMERPHEVVRAVSQLSSFAPAT